MSLNMEVHFTDGQKFLIRQAIASGRYSTLGDVIREALSLWEAQERRRAEIMAAVDQAEASFAIGEGLLMTTPEETEHLADEIRKRGMLRLAEDAGNR